VSRAADMPLAELEPLLDAVAELLVTRHVRGRDLIGGAGAQPLASIWHRSGDAAATMVAEPAP
jgi:hypothetical protein